MVLNLAKIDSAGFPLVLSQRLAFEFEPIGVMHQAIQDGIGHGGVGDDLVPLADGELAGDESSGS